MSKLIKSIRKGFGNIPAIVIQNAKQFEGIKYTTEELCLHLKTMPFYNFTVEYYNDTNDWCMFHVKDNTIDFFNSKQKRLPFTVTVTTNETLIRFDTERQMDMFTDSIETINMNLCFLASIIEATMMVNTEVVNISEVVKVKDVNNSKKKGKVDPTSVIRLKNKVVRRRQGGGIGTGKSPSPHYRRAHKRRVFNKQGSCVGTMLIAATTVGDPTGIKMGNYVL